ncbi:MAG TPA: sigma factor [Candidatus Acidoferrum sp.]|jgi:RNA polymerase sigma factor (sigma-70 family)|nr:sigma factor [Candidatus Acidoferrum sp.]
MNAPGESFPLTRLSVLAAARSDDTAERSRALDLLFAAYWKPIYKYLRLKYSQAPSDAQDLTQGFFAELLERDLLSRFDPAKSRLRTYLRLCADSFALNEIKAASRKKRGSEFTHVALDFSAAEDELRTQTIDPAIIPSPESLDDFFEKEWIRSLFSSAVAELQKLCESRGKQKAFAMFETYDLDGEENVSYADLASRHSLPVTDVNNQIAWARREFRRIAMDQLRALCGSDEEFVRESKALFGGTAK